MRDDSGDFIAAAAGRLTHVKDALQAETEACVAAAEGANALGLHRVIFESDCKTLVEAVRSRSHDLAHVGVLLKEIRSICIGSFESWRFEHVLRSGNCAAHSLSQYGLRAEIMCTGWEGEAPGFISDVVASEIAVPL